MISTEARTRGFLIPLKLVNRAVREGVPLTKLQEMVQRSARITHPEGNRRFHDFLFLVQGNRVVEYKRLEEEAELHHKCEHCSDSGRVQVFDTCDKCDGTGCKACDQGLVPSSIPCPMCKVEAPMSFRKKVAQV